jgi:signal transduction histidine kinase
MKKTIYLLVLLISFRVQAQNEVFRIDSLPKEGILLDKGWKFHAGDNPDFAKPDFDDSKWESIDPTLQINDLSALRNIKIGWLRLRCKISPKLKNSIFSVESKQVVAAEFFKNGKFFGNFGLVSNDPHSVVAFHNQSFLKPVLHFFITDEDEIVLAVRIAQQTNLKIPKLEFVQYQTNFLSLRLYQTDLQKSEIRNAIKGNNYELRGDFEANSLDFFKAGLFLILSFLHITLFYFNKTEKSNLLFGLSCAFLFVFYLYEAICRSYFYDLSSVLIYLRMFWFLSLIGYLFTLSAVYELFEIKRKVVFYILLFISTIIIISAVLDIDFLLIYGAIICVLIYLDIARISFIAYFRKKIDAQILVTGSVIYVFFLILFILYSLFPRDSRIPEHIFANLGYLSIPFSLTFILAKSFARTGQVLKLKLLEVKTLSDEKQEALQKQNSELQAALLKGQTIERQRVAADLHDNLGSTLSALWLNVDMIDKSKMNAEEREIHQNLRENLEKAYNDVRLLSHNLLPEEFEKQGLVPTLQGFVRKISKNSKIRFDLNIAEGFGRVDNKIEFELYSICLELVNNIIKHSKATEAKIALSRTEKQIELIISDNGIGTFNNESDGKGMKNVKARVESLNGTWRLQNIENQGVRSEILIPV